MKLNVSMQRFFMRVLVKLQVVQLRMAHSMPMEKVGMLILVCSVHAKTAKSSVL